MTGGKLDSIPSRLETLLAQDRDLVKVLLKEALDQILQAEMTEFLGAAPGEPSVMRVGSRAGYYKRGLITRAGKIELRVPRDRSGEFSTALFERFQRSEKALVSALAEMYVQGESTRKVKAINEALCGHRFCSSGISTIKKGLDETLTKFARRRPAGAALDLRPQEPHRAPARSGQLAASMGEEVPEAHRLGRGEHRLDAHVLPPAAASPPAHEEHQHDRAAQRGVAPAYARRAHLPQHRQLLEADQGALRRDARGLARGQPLHQHGSAARRAQGATQEGSVSLRP